MEQIEFKFIKDTFSKIFPFYILLDTNLCIKSYGKSIPKIIPELKKTLFKDNFSISRPHVEEYSINQFNTIINQLVILKSNYKDETILKGQFEILDEGYLFIGSPWFVSIDEVVQKKLSINDFAFHDSLLDILHVSKNYEINYNDLKVLLKTVNNQRNILKKDKEELNKLSLVARANKNGVVIFDTKGIISWCNDAYLNIVGLPLNKIIGSSIHDFEPDKRYDPIEIESILNEFEKGVIFNNEKTTISPDGKKIWFKTIKQPVRDADGKILNYFAIIEDVTSEKEKEEKLLLLSSLAEKNISAIIICDNSGAIEWVNDSFVELTEYTREDVLGKKLYNIVKGPKTSVETIEFIKNQIINGAEINTEIINYKKSKTPFWSKLRGRAITNDKGDVLKYFTSQEDISFEKEHRQNLIDSENRLYSLIKNFQSGILLEDVNRKIQLVNKKFCDIFGIDIDPELMQGFDCSDSAEQTKSQFKNPDIFIKRLKTILREQKLVIAEEIEMADGRILERSYIPILKDKKYDGHLWNYVDVTIKKRYDQSLEIEKTKYSSIIDNMNMGLLEVDNNDIIQLANQSFCLMSGYKKSELIGKNASTIFLNEMNEKIINNKLVDRTIKSITDSYEIDIKNKSKEIRHWMISGAPNFNLNGEVIGSIGIHLDITEKKKLEIQKEELLLKLEKQNESLNDYAHMISHDLKSPLRSIHTLISWIKEEKDMLFTENGKKYMDMLVEKVEKMDNLIDGVLTISKLDTTAYKYQEVDLNEVLNVVIAMIHIPSHVTIEITNKFPTIYTDRYRIQQLFQNLISNAVNYSNKEEGKVTITYKDIDDFYLFSIKDNGIGIEKSYHEKIFDIFESYSDDSKSSGIGLSIVKKIIENYKGEIWLESELNKGSIFYFKIPKVNNGTT